MRFRSATAATLGAVLALSACTATNGPDPGPSEAESPADPIPAAVAQRPGEKYSVLDAGGEDAGEAEAISSALDASGLLFASAEVALLASADDPAAIVRAGATGIALHAPVLLIPSPGSDEGGGNAPEDTADTGGADSAEAAGSDDTDSAEDPSAAESSAEPGEDSGAADGATAPIATELDRLGTTSLVTFGELDTAALDDVRGERTTVAAPADTGELGALLGLDLTELDEAQPSDAEAHPSTVLAGLDAGQVPPGSDSPPVSGGSADPSDPSDSRDPSSPGSADPTSPATLPPLLPGEQVEGLNVIVDGAPTQAAALATARAAGAHVAIAPGDPRSAADAIAALPEAEATVGVGPYGDVDTFAWQVATAATGEELPGGGQLVFDDKRYIALYGSPHSADLGILGHQDLPATIDLAAEYAAKYDDLTEDDVIPTLEVIVTVASGSAGSDGNYSNEWPAGDYVPMIEAAAEAGQYVVLDFQPGRTNFLDQLRDYEDLLAYPNVGIALDPEWRLKSDQVHLRQIGSVTVAEVNSVIDYLADFVRERNLPQKMVVLHQFQRRMITDRGDLDLSRPEVALLIHADGNGTPGAKLATWDNVRTGAPAGMHWGWKNFLEKDYPMLTPEQTFEIDPVPDYVSYQ